MDRMTKLHDLLENLDHNKGTADPSAQTFHELDLERMKNDLRLAKEGQERGEKNLPASTSEVLDDIEHKIIAAIEAEQRRQQQTLKNQLNDYDQRIAKLDLEHEAINIASAAQRASTEFIVKVDEGKSKLFTLWRNVCMIEKQWNDFRAKHNLTHPADYPLSRLWNFAVVLVILTIESVLNGSFLARGLETGLIGGVIEAFVIAAINVSFGFFLGDSVMRYLFHRNYWLRWLTLAEVPVSCAIAVFFNLLVGHYRDALGGPDPTHASAEALYSFKLHPFALVAFESWVLFAMGLFFSLVAAIDGFKMDDPYPGYGKISRKHEEIIHEYMDEKANIIGDLSYTRDQALDYIRDARQNLAARRSELSGILDQRGKLLYLSETHQNYLNRAANDLLSTYRNANIRARTTPAPTHFNGNYTLPTSVSLASQAFANNEKLLDANIDKTDTALQKAISQVSTQFEEAVREFHHIGELTRGSDHGSHAATS
jgi:hypothetical protein